jgi:flagellar protein FliS
MNAQNAYLEGRILSADPLELVRILYEEAVDSVIAARAHLRSGDIAARSREITRGQLILLELRSSLDHQRGGDLSVRLYNMYDYMHRRLTAANLEQREEPLSEVERLLMTLLEGWRACRPEHEHAAASLAGAPEPAGGALPTYSPMLEAEPEMAGHSWVY